MTTEYTFRKMKPGDLEAITRISRLAFPYDPITADLINEKTYGDDFFSADSSFVATSGGKVVGFAPVAVSSYPKEDSPWVGYLKLLAVHPHHRDQGVATQLLARIEDALGKFEVETLKVFAHPYNYLTPGVDMRMTSAHCWLTKNGFKKTGESLNMRCDLLRLPGHSETLRKTLENNGISIRRARDKDQSSLFDFINKHFHGWEREAGQTFANTPISTWVALAGRRIVGFASSEGNNIGSGNFGPMGTDPDFRGQRIGEVLCLRALIDLIEFGHRTAVIPWVGPVKFYARVCHAYNDRIFFQYEKNLIEEK